jgi:hypothetical protein
MIVGFIIGFILGLILGIIGIEPNKSIMLILGIIIGLAISTIPMKMILGKDFGEFRLVLLSKATSITAPTSTQT